jgi:aminopeptidase N
MTKKVRRLFAGFQPEHYSLTINPDRDTMRIRGQVTIIGQRRGRPSQRLTFHQNGLKITEARITHIDKKTGRRDIAIERINHQKSLNEVRLHTNHLLYSGTYEVSMTFEGVITEGMHGIYPCHYELNGKKQALIATQFESHHAREAFPCIDEPEAKATFDMTLISPIGEITLSNTPVKTQEEKDGKLHTTFETSPRMSTYLLAFVYGDLQSKEAQTKDGVDVRVWSTRAHPAESLDFALDISVRAIEQFNEYFGVPYPLPKCDHVALPDFSAGAMENWGLITYREICLLAHPVTTPQTTREFVAIVVCHELSHQWFGNLVTMKWWDDLWLNESFANVMEYLMPDRLIPEWRFWDAFVVNEGLSAFRRDSIAGVQAVKTEVHHPDEISTLFDPSIVYAKGGRLLNMLRNYLGDEAFSAGLQQYFLKHAYKNTLGNDLWQALSEAAGIDAGAFMTPWLLQSGFPVVSVDQNARSLTLNQSHFLMDPAKADLERIWPVPLLSDAAGVPGLLDKKQATVTLASDAFIRINRGAVGHYVVHYKNPEHAAAIANLAKSRQLDVPERLMLLSDSSMLARAGIQQFAASLELLEMYAGEDSEPVWDMMSLIIADARRFIDAAPDIEPAIKKMLRGLIEALYTRLGWEEAPDEPVQHTKLRATIIGLGVYAEHPEITRKAQKLFEMYKADPQANPHVIPTELRSIVFSAAVRNNMAGAFSYLLEVEESTNDVDLKQDIISALTLTHDTQQVARLLARLKDPGKVRPQDLDRQLIYLMRNRYGRDDAWKWLRDNWSWIEKTFSGDKSYDSFPRYAASSFNTRKLLEEYQAFFGPMQDQPALSRNITMGIEELENRISWIERDLAGLCKFFTRYA